MIPPNRAALAEELVVHYIAGRWRAPLATRALDVGRGLGRIACAGPDDARRALAGLRPAPVDRAALARDWAGARGWLGARRQAEGIADPLGALPETAPQIPAGPIVVLSAAGVPLADVVAVLALGQGVLWKPAPGAAASAHALIEALRTSLGAGVAMVQGDHASGQALAALGLPVLWISPDPSPPAGDWLALSRGATG